MSTPKTQARRALGIPSGETEYQLEIRWLSGMATLSVLMILIATGCASGPPKQSTLQGVSYTRHLDQRVLGYRRSYRIHVPPDRAEGKALPLIVAVHGAFSSPDQFARQTGFDELADRAGFVVAYPAAFAPPFPTWNSGHCCGLARTIGLDDVAFVASVISDVKSHRAIDENRVYLVGHSNGGMLVHRFTAERPDGIAGAAVVAGTIGGRPSSDEPIWRISEPRRPVPMLVLHGRFDTQVDYDGGLDPRAWRGRTWISARDSALFWSEQTQCVEQSSARALVAGWVQREIWTGPGGCRVELHTVEGWGHRFPGLSATRELRPDHPLRGFHGSEHIWNFFRASASTKLASSGASDSGSLVASLEGSAQ
jgi:polyhydroxybutyrate depolymerase